MRPSALIPVVLLTTLSACQFSGKETVRPGSSRFEHFVTVDGDRLKDGDRDLRFISFNIPNLHYVEDDMQFEKTLPYRFPNEFEIADALNSVRQLGGQVVRMYTLTVRKEDDPEGLPRHVLGPGEFNEDGFVALDKILQLANQIGVRIIIPFVDNWHWLGGVREYAAFRGKERDEFWTDPQLFDDFKKTVDFVINRKNTYTGVRYRDDKAILAWETGNELTGPRAWSWKVADYIKTIDSNHLVLDGSNARLLPEDAFQNPNVDIVQTHHYENNPRDMVEHVRQSARLARGRKPYILGEFGFISTEGVRAVIDTIMEEGVVGGMTWSLRYHNRDGGFYWHHEPSGGDLFKAYHWPGFHSGINYDEKGFLHLIRQKAYEIQGMDVPPIPVPAAPHLLPISDPSQIAWQGSAGASSYNVERSDSPGGPWTVVGREVSDAVYQYRPAFNDFDVEKGHSCYYRVVARNYNGLSEASNVVGPVKALHKTIVDEMENNSRFFFSHGSVAFLENEARKFKEDSHRLKGDRGSYIIYYAPESISSWKVYSFSDADTTHFKFSISTDGKSFSGLVPDRRNYFTGGGDYGYQQPILYFRDSMQTSARYLKIEFVANVQITRVEVKY